LEFPAWKTTTNYMSSICRTPEIIDCEPENCLKAALGW